MMKKLLIFMLVLGLAATANAVTAGFSLKVAYNIGTAPPPPENYFDPVDSELILFPSDTLWIGVDNAIMGVKGAMQKPQLMLGIVLPGQGFPANTTWTSQQAQYKGGPGDPETIPPMVPKFYRGDPLVEGAPLNTYFGIVDFWGDGSLFVDLWLVNLSDAKPDTANGIGLLDAKDLHCNFGPSDDVVILWDQDAVELDRILIHQIPEPATIALLGLGGLLLRRRK
jgi:hypothetical protein